MARKVISLSLEEDTIKEIDELSEKMGVSRSTFCEMTLRTAVGGQSLKSFYEWLSKADAKGAKSAIESKKVLA